MNRIFIIFLLLLTACASRPEYSQSTYTTGEVGEVKPIVGCEVLAVREITIRDPEGAKEGEALGTLLGGILGATLGGTVGGDKNDRQLGSAIGGIAGAIGGSIAGDQIGENRASRKGLEYSVLTDNGEELVLAQEFLEGDAIIAPGQSCRLQISGNNNRVLPSSYSRQPTGAESSGDSYL